ncbi:MAG: hypothetical protein IPM56_11195 [Ignavibacteriales bacterium]|nr:MAG: hypothetical protein IPM56_11195 [Ignavibacteriales bacterium]
MKKYLVVIFIAVISLQLTAQNKLSLLSDISDIKPTNYEDIENNYVGYSSSNALGQIFLTPLSAIIFALPGVTSLNDNGGGMTGAHGPQDGNIILSYTLYVIGSAVGAFTIAQIENDDLSFWKTLGASAIGGGIGTVTILITSVMSETNNLYLLALFPPVIASVAYTLGIADFTPVTNKPQMDTSIEMKIKSQQDLINFGSMKVELFRINL